MSPRTRCRGARVDGISRLVHTAEIGYDNHLRAVCERTPDGVAAGQALRTVDELSPITCPYCTAGVTR